MTLLAPRNMGPTAATLGRHVAGHTAPWGLGQIWPGSGQFWADAGLVWADSDPMPPMLTELVSTCSAARNRPSFDRSRLNLGPVSAKFHPKSTRLGPSWSWNEMDQTRAIVDQFGSNSTSVDRFRPQIWPGPTLSGVRPTLGRFRQTLCMFCPTAQIRHDMQGCFGELWARGWTNLGGPISTDKLVRRGVDRSRSDQRLPRSDEVRAGVDPGRGSTMGPAVFGQMRGARGGSQSIFDQQRPKDMGPRPE